MVDNERRTINQSELAKLFKKDRATVRTWLEEEGIEPTNSNKRNYLYDYDEAVAMVQRRTNQKWKETKTENEAKLLDVKLQKELGNYGSVAEFADLTQEWVKWLHNQLSIKMPKQVIKRIAKSKNEQDATAILQKAVDSIFNEFRSNPKKFLDGK